MKVKELIEKLNTMEQENEVFICYEGHYFSDIEFEEHHLVSYFDESYEDKSLRYDAESYVEKLVIPRNPHIKIVEKFPAYVLDMY